MDTVSRTFRGRSEYQPTKAVARENSTVLASAQFWHDRRRLKVLGMGTALPGPPVRTSELLEKIEDRFGIAVARRGIALANRLNIATRHLCRDFEARHQAPRAGHSNPDLAADALPKALEEAQLNVNDLPYLVVHTTLPHSLMS